MKLYFCHLFLVCGIFLFGGCEQPTEKAKYARSTLVHVSKNLENNFGLKFIGFSEATDEKMYVKLGLRFNLYKIISKAEGREILVKSVNELLRLINATPELISYLNPNPFSLSNVEVVIFVYHPNGDNVYYPDISVFSIRRGELQYKTQIENDEYSYHTIENESYDEALRVINHNT